MGRRQRLGHRHRQVVEAVVVHHVHVVTPAQGQHQVEVGVVLASHSSGCIETSRLRGVAQVDRPDVEQLRAELRVGAGTGEDGEVDAPRAQSLDEVPRQRLHPAGERLADRVT